MRLKTTAVFNTFHMLSTTLITRKVPMPQARQKMADVDVRSAADCVCTEARAGNVST